MYTVKLRTLLDLQGNISSFMHIGHGRWNDMRALDVFPFEAGAVYVMDGGYLDFERLYRLARAAALVSTRSCRFSALLFRKYTAKSIA